MHSYLSANHEVIDPTLQLVCVCVCVCVSIYLHTHTHTHKRYEVQLLSS